MISILIATYNSDKTLQACLNSVLEQDYKDWECILVDGKSQDKTLSIIEEFERSDNRIRHISEPDSGIYDALNKGIDLAQGAWIYVLGSDDRLTKNGLASLIFGSNADSSVIYGDIFVEYADQSNKLIHPKEIEMVKYYMPISHQGVIVKTDDARMLGGFDLRYKVRGDYNMIQQLYLLGKVFQYVSVPIAICGVSGLSNKLSSMIKYDLERYHINKNNKSNKYPFLFWLIIEIRSVLIDLRDRMMGRKYC
jgi:glycosyltransferase